MEITVEELRALGDAGAAIVNVGKHAGSAEIRGAVRYRPHDLLEPAHLTLPLAPERLTVLYDEDGDRETTEQIAGRLEHEGFTDVRILKGGFAAWKQADGPTQEPSMEQVVPPSRSSEVQELDRRI